MIFLRLFFVFSKIGLFNFGGGYAMLSFIQSEVVAKQGWMTEQEFTDIVAISQMTPGPIGINAATYVGYTAVANDAAMQAAFTPAQLGFVATVGSVVATVAVVWLPFIVMLAVSRILLRHKGSLVVESVFRTLRPAVVGLIAAAALALMTTANFGDPSEDILSFTVSIVIFAAVFFGSRRWHWHPIAVICVCGVIGFLLYGLPTLV